MKKLKQNTTSDAPRSRGGVVSKLPYLIPWLEVHMVELESDCLAATSGTGTSSGNPNVNDWNDETLNGDVNWP